LHGIQALVLCGGHCFLPFVLFCSNNKFTINS